MTTVDEPCPGAVWALLSPDGSLTWHPLGETADVEEAVGGEHGATDRAWVAGPLRIMASDVGLLFPERYPPNPIATEMLLRLSGNRLVQPWRGHVALVEYEQDPETRELLWPGEMSAEWSALIMEARQKVPPTVLPGKKRK